MAEYIDRTQIKWYGCDHEGRGCIPSGGHCEKCFFGTCNHDEVMNIKPADVVERSKVNAAIEKIKNFNGYKEGLDTMNVGDDIMISWLITLEILKNI